MFLVPQPSFGSSFPMKAKDRVLVPLFLGHFSFGSFVPRTPLCRASRMQWQHEDINVFLGLGLWGRQFQGPRISLGGRGIGNDLFF